MKLFTKIDYTDRKEKLDKVKLIYIFYNYVLNNSYNYPL